MRIFLFYAGLLRRVIALSSVLLFGLLASVYSPYAAASAPSSGTYQYQGQAYNACQAYLADFVAGGGILGDQYCYNGTAGGKPTGAYIVSGHGGAAGRGPWNWTQAAPSNPCTAAYTSQRIYNSGKITQGASICGRAADNLSGGTVQCALTFTPISPPTQSQYSGAWETYGTLAPSGNLCGGTEGDPWKDGNGGAMNPSPAVPTLPAVDVAVPPKMCGGGSCYDPKTDQYCGVSGGQQFCVTGAKARSSAGGCASSGDATICSGSPNAPAPPPPPASPISNPLTQIKSQDNTTQADPVTGVPQNISTTVYAQPSANVQSGQQPGDSGPAPSSSTGGPEVTSSGGADCNTPPIVTGSPGLAQVAFQAWKTRCAIEGTQGGVAGGVGSLYTKSTDTVGSVVGEFRASVADTPIGTTVANFFSVGSVGGACPVWTLPANDYLPAMTFDFYCAPELADLLDMARIVLLIGFAFVAWRIAMGDS